MKRLRLCSLALLYFVSLSNVLALDFPYSEWNLASYEGAYATFNDGIVSVASGGADYWHVQLTRKNIELQAGKTYEVKFFLQGVSARRYVDVRIGRESFPYDAFAEFGEVVAAINGRTVTKTFTMQSGNVSNARFEFNLGKTAGTIYFSDVSLNCLDCSGANQGGSSNSPATSASDWGYVVVADTVDLRDYSMALGDVFGSKLELGADSKVYGSVDASHECFLRERAYIGEDLRYSAPCTEQNSVSAATKSVAALSKPLASIPNIAVGISPISVGLDKTITLLPGNYGSFYANARSKVHFASGAYTFQNFYTEPDVEFSFDMASGPISIGILNNVRFGDRNHFSIAGGNPSEISWNVAGETVDLGTDGLYFGKILAPAAYVRIPSRSHLVGGVYARKFVMEPQSTVSQEPRAKEISHSEEHFGPFFEPGVFRYRSQLSLSASTIEMYVYADDLQVKVNGGKSTTVEFPSTNGTATISLSRSGISGFPTEAFSSNYTFNFSKSANYRIYWNPQTQCEQGCDGATAAVAIGDFATALEIAKTTGREINMAGGVWDVSATYKNGIVPWSVGFELVGNTVNLWDLNSESDLPLVNLGNSAHIKIEGRSPRSLTGLRIANGFNAGNGGAISTSNQKISLKNMLISSSKSNGDGGAIFAGDTLNLEYVRFSSNTALGDGGAVLANGETNMLNVLYLGNSSAKNGGAVELKNANTYIGNTIFYGNNAGLAGGAIHNENTQLNLWNATFFANAATAANGAIGGTAKGVIGNSIFWKNTVSGCSSGECSSEVVAGYTAMNSSFTKTYAGTSNYAGDPKFADESNPSGKNMYMDYDAGINLAEGSPLLKAGVKNDYVPANDLLEEERKTGQIALGVYAYAMPNNETSFGVLNEEGKVVATRPAIPLISAISGDYYREYLATSPYARVFKATVRKHKKTKKAKAHVKLWVKNYEGKIYKDIPPVEFDAYRNGEENGRYVFQTMTLSEGKPIFFSKRPQDAGNYKDGIVVYMKSVSDYFYYEAK